jgi:hypothetical protein
MRMSSMGEPSPKARHVDRLIAVDATEQRDLLKPWQANSNGMDGPCGGVPEKPDDQVANLLLEAAGTAIGRGQVQRGVNILQLVVRDYRESQEAALARAALDQLAKGKCR